MMTNTRICNICPFSDPQQYGDQSWPVYCLTPPFSSPPQYHTNQKHQQFSGLRGVALQNKRKLPPTMGAPGSKMRRLHGLLAAAEEKKQRLAALRQSEEGKEKAKQEVWGDAIRVAGGEELKDNPAALKKTIKRKEKDKAKSAKEWDKRLAGQKKDQSARQSKREENLNKKKQGGLVADSAAAGDGAEAAGGKVRKCGSL